MPYFNEKLPKVVREKAQVLARRMAGSWQWWSKKPPSDDDVARLMRAWYCTAFADERAQEEYLAKCARLGLPHLMDGWDVDKPCRTIDALKSELEVQVAQWLEDAAEEDEDPSVYYDADEVARAEEWLDSHTFLFWLLGHVIEESASSWAKDSAVNVAATENAYDGSYVDVSGELRADINRTVERFFDVYQETLSDPTEPA